MDRPYDSIPRQGEHRGGDLDEEPTTNVRAQEAVKPTSDDSTAGGIIQSSFNPAKGHYRIRLWQKEADAALEHGYEEIQTLPKGESLADTYEALPEEPRYIVLENVESGEVYFDPEGELTDNWTGDGRFDQVTIFNDEEAAARYASSRQDPS